MLFGVTAWASTASSQKNYYYKSEAITTTPLSSLPTNPTTAELKQAIVFVSNQYGLKSDKIIALAMCESSLNVKSYNPKDTDGLPAIGLFQFKERTFYWFAEKYKIKEPDVLSPVQQIILTHMMIADGYAHLWGCNRSGSYKIKNSP